MEKVPEVPKLRSISFASSSTHALHYSYIVLALNSPPYRISPKKEKRKKKKGLVTWDGDYLIHVIPRVDS